MLDTGVWVHVVDHLSLKMAGSVVKVKKLPVVLCWYMFYIAHYFSNCHVPAMYITVSLSMHKSSSHIFFTSCITLKSKDFSQQLYLIN